MSEFEYLVRRLRDEPLRSRNRNYDELSAPDARRARRLLRRLAGLKREIEAGAIVALSHQFDGFLLTIAFPALRAKRVAFLSADEAELLRQEVALPDAARY